MSNESKHSKPDCPLIRQDGNIFNLVGIASRTLKRNSLSAPLFLRKAVGGHRGEKPLSAAIAVLRHHHSERTSVSAVERLVLKELDKPDKKIKSL